jgi:hypothetical protein
VKPIAKSKQTTDLEQAIWDATCNQGTFGCFEVTIGWFGRERVDFMTYDTNGIWRCYEIKVTKSDFHSKSSKTFLGHYNYYVMPDELYEEVKGEIPSHIGVHNGERCLKNAKKQELGIDEQILKNSMIRSLYREVSKQVLSGKPLLIEEYRRRLRETEREKEHYRNEWWELYKSTLPTEEL